MSDTGTPTPDQHAHDTEHHHGHGGEHPSTATDVSAMWDERYATQAWPTSPDPLLVRLVNGLEPGTALDLGCGTGRNAVWLAQRGWDVTGVDSSTVGLAQANERAKQTGCALTTVQADLTTYTTANAYQLVVLANMHLPPADRAHLFSTAAHAVSPGGHLYVVGHHVESLGLAGPPDPERLFTEALLASSFPDLTTEQLGRTQHGDTSEHTTAGDVYLWAVRRA
ncbi:MAG: class I SAM-dependent methyltransferase [Actinomycetota bacterium]|nr:class I SAM-dependent methyltransferase [Actinomycetota bacterium]